MLLRFALTALYALNIEAYDQIDRTVENDNLVQKGMKFPQFDTHGKSRFIVQKRKEPEQAAKKNPIAVSGEQTRFTLVRMGNNNEAEPSAHDLENNSNGNDNMQYPQDNNSKRFKIVNEITAEILQQNDDEEGIEIEDLSKSDESDKKETKNPQFDYNGKSKYVKEKRKIPGIVDFNEESGEFQKKQPKQYINSGDKRYEHVKKKEKPTQIEDNSGKSNGLNRDALDSRKPVIQYPKFDIEKSNYVPVSIMKKPIEVYNSGVIKIGVSSANETTDEMKETQPKNYVQNGQTRFNLIPKRKESVEENNLIKEKEFKWQPQPNYSEFPEFNQKLIRSAVGGPIGQPPSHSNQLDPPRLTPKTDQRVRWTKLDKGGPRKKMRLVFFDKRPTKVFGVNVFFWLFLTV